MDQKLDTSNYIFPNQNHSNQGQSSLQNQTIRHQDSRMPYLKTESSEGGLGLQSTTQVFNNTRVSLICKDLSFPTTRSLRHNSNRITSRIIINKCSFTLNFSDNIWRVLWRIPKCILINQEEIYLRSITCRHHSKVDQTITMLLLI